MGWIEDVARNLAFFLDKIVYSLIEWVYKMFVSLAQINISETITKSFASRIYAFLGIFMLFRLAFSLITYLINPDNLKEQKKGGAALVKRIFISILLMALVPTIFKEAYSLQKIILEEDIIGQIIMGQPISKDDSDGDHSGERMAFTVFSAFFFPDISGDDNPCKNPFSKSGLTENCRVKLVELGGETVADTYEEAYRQLNVGYLDSIVNAKTSDKHYVFFYKAFVSTIAGGFVFWIFIIFLIDLSLRVVKLAFLQLISPIPIISYIDPKEG